LAHSCTGALRCYATGREGEITLDYRKEFLPEVTLAAQAIYKKLKEKFPYSDLCIWDTTVLNQFMLHLPSQVYIMVEMNRESTTSGFYFLRELKKSVFVEPTADILEKYADKEKEVFIVKPLISEAPTLLVNEVETAAIEKILIDIFCDEVIFQAQQGAEMRLIFREAFCKYRINQNRMLRYADRRGKKEEVDQFVKSISKFWQN
jgi:hypothetical protein